MLTIKNLYKSYKLKGRTVLANNDISIQIENSQMIGIFGKSGSGKSTFLNQIVGLDKADSGEIIWGDKNIINYKSSQSSDFRKNNCGIVFQFFELLKAQSAYDNAALPLKLLKKSSKEIEHILIPLFETFDAKDFMKTKAAFLSGGEMQRVAIIRSLSTSPKYIIADEITASLDEKLSNFVYLYLRDYIKKNLGVGIFVSHDMLLEKYIDRKFIMDNGKLIEEE
jgi:putative ABC transport system ATP-binding protein